MMLFCNKCESQLMIELGVPGVHLEPSAAEQVVTVQCERRCYGRWYAVFDGSKSLASTIEHIKDAATVGPLKHVAVVVP